jgi:hypothetical protein
MEGVQVMDELSNKDLVLLRLAVSTFIQKRMKIEVDDVRAVASEELRDGDAHTIRSPLDREAKIARVSMSEPKPSATITNRSELEAWISTYYPEKLVERTEIVGAMSEVLEVLRVHAPHLIEDRKGVPDWAVAELVRKSESARQPVGWGGEMDVPGIEVSTPAGSLRVTLDREADAAIRELWERGQVGMDGSFRQIEGGA